MWSVGFRDRPENFGILSSATLADAGLIRFDRVVAFISGSMIIGAFSRLARAIVGKMRDRGAAVWPTTRGYRHWCETAV
jgi:hypothetical protein